MANYTSLKAAVANVVKTNGHGDITGAALQSVINENIIPVLGLGYQYMGFAETNTDPGTPDARVFYLANKPGTYTNFGGLTVSEPSFLYYDTTWHVKSIVGSWNPTEVVNNLNSTSTTSALSANMGHSLNGMITALTDYINQGYIFMGAAIPSTTSPSDRAMRYAWIASTEGTYTNMGNISLIEGEIAIIYRTINAMEQPVYSKATIAVIQPHNIYWSDTVGAPSANNTPANWNSSLWGAWSGAPLNMGDVYIDRTTPKVYMATFGGGEAERFTWTVLN